MNFLQQRAGAGLRSVGPALLVFTTLLNSPSAPAQTPAPASAPASPEIPKVTVANPKQKDLKQSASRIHYAPGDAIRGERITAQFRTMHKPTILTGSSTHQIQQSKLEGSVYCVVDKPLNYLRDVIE